MAVCVLVCMVRPRGHAATRALCGRTLGITNYGFMSLLSHPLDRWGRGRLGHGQVKPHSAERGLSCIPLRAWAQARVHIR